MTRAPTAASLAAVFLIAVAALLGIGASPAAAAKPCWERVLDDWTDNSRIDGVYSAACLQEALQRVPEDLRTYSDFEDQIRRALQASVRRPQSATGSNDSDDSIVGSGGSSDNGNGGPRRPTEPVVEREPNTGPRDEGPFDSVLGSDTTDARSIPIPLIILATLAVLLITAGGAGLVVRKLRARRLVHG
jgi:hypothetical protein